MVTPALRWTLPYLEENMGSTKHTVYLSKSRTFMYYDEKKVSWSSSSSCILLALHMTPMNNTVSKSGQLTIGE